MELFKSIEISNLDKLLSLCESTWRQRCVCWRRIRQLPRTKPSRSHAQLLSVRTNRLYHLLEQVTCNREQDSLLSIKNIFLQILDFALFKKT